MKEDENKSLKRVKESFFSKLVNWFKQKYLKGSIKMCKDEAESEVENIKEENFIDKIKIVKTKEEKELIEKFENGEIKLEEVSDEIFGLIINGYFKDAKNANVLSN